VLWTRPSNGALKNVSEPGNSKRKEAEEEELLKLNAGRLERSMEEGGPGDDDGEERGEEGVVVVSGSLAVVAALCAASFAFLRASAAAFFSRDVFGSLMKVHSLPREMHLVQGCLRSHLTLDSAQAWHDLRRDLF
jgi:hypothetical protein